MRNLKEIYDSGSDIKDSEIPKEWKDSFDRFIFGSACQAETDKDGNVTNFIYYSCDFRQWYSQNRPAIERDIKINKIIKNDKG